MHRSAQHHSQLHQIQGLTEAERRVVGINMSGGVANAIEICNTVLQLPALAELGEIYMKHRTTNDVTPMKEAA